MTDYSKTVIYKIQHNDDDSLLYVGHTTNFTKRKNRHKNNCKTHSLQIYKTIRENGGWECFTMIVLKDFPCASKTEACIEEDKVMREMKTSMNKYRAYTTPEEKLEMYKECSKAYRLINKEQIIEKKKQYHQANKELINQKNKAYRLVNKEQISEKQKEYQQANRERLSEKKKEYQQANRERLSEKKKEYHQANKELLSEKKKEYRDKNKELINQKNKAYQQANRELISEKAKETIECECGCIIRKSDLARHKKSKKHLSLTI
jgi:hypothetical protein